MRWKCLGIGFVIIVVAGCSTTKYRRAEKYIETRQYNAAIRHYIRILKPHKRRGKLYINYDKEAFTGIGVVYWQKQDFQTAAKVLSHVIKRSPNYGRALFYLGMSLEGLGSDDDAERIYRRYPHLSSSDQYRNILMGRLDWVVRKKITREVQLVLQNEADLRNEDLPENSIAVLYFTSLSEDPQWHPLQKGLAEMMITDLAQIEELQVVERLRLNKLMEELRLSASGLVDEGTAPRLGKLLGARNLVKGSYLVMSDRDLSVDAGIYEPDRILLPTTISHEGPLTRLFQIEKELVLRVLDNFGIELTPQQRERILKIPTENLMAFMEYCKGLDALDHEDFDNARTYFLQAVRLDHNFQAAADWLMPEAVWAATHNRNPRRVDYEIAELIRKADARTEITYVPPEELVSTWNRLQWMSVYQNAGFLPGADSRESFQEAERKGASVLPQLLGTPPVPPNK